MAKKHRQGAEITDGDFSKGFSTGAFTSLKSLQTIRKAESEEKAERARQAEEAVRRREAEARNAASAMRDFRFTEADLGDESGLSDAEIFEQSMRQMDTGPVDVYQSKFNVKEQPKPSHKEVEAPLTLSDEEREFALFTQEMALSNVKRLTKPAKPAPKQRNKRKPQNEAATLEDTELSGVQAAPAAAEQGMRTGYIAPNVTVTQVEKGEDVEGEGDSLTASQKQLLKDIKRHEARYGFVITLKLRGLTLNAAMARLDEFVAACVREHRPYALIICGKGLGSAGEPVIKNHTIEVLRSDQRVVEYAPVINSDGDFGSLYISLRKG